MRPCFTLFTLFSVTYALTSEQIAELRKFRAGRILPITSLETSNYPVQGNDNDNYGTVVSKYSFGPGGVPLVPNTAPLDPVDQLLGSALESLGNLGNFAGLGAGKPFQALGALNNFGFGGFGGFGGLGGGGGMPDLPFVPKIPFLDGLFSNIPITNGQGGSISSSVPVGENGHVDTNVGGGYGYGVGPNSFGFGTSFGGSFSFDSRNPPKAPPQTAFSNMNGEPVQNLDTSFVGGSNVQNAVGDTADVSLLSKAAPRMTTEKTEGVWDDWYRHK